MSDMFSAVYFFPNKVDQIIKDVRVFFSRCKLQKEWESMQKAVVKLQKCLLQYMGHRLRAKVQFSAIKELKNSLKTNMDTIMVVMDHKQKILQMKYREGQVEYYGKSGMSMLGTMIISWTDDDKQAGFNFHFWDFILKGYTSQDNTQVAAVVQLIVKRVKECLPNVNKIIFQSDNATCFASQELIPYIYHLNIQSKEKKLPTISKWIFTEAQTGRGRLDTHFAYVNCIIKSYVQDGNNIVLEEHILKALSFNGGLAGTSAILVNCSDLEGPCVTKKFRSKKVKSRATHEIEWFEDKVHITENSGITQPEVVLRTKLEKHELLNLKVTTEEVFDSDKPALFVGKQKFIPDNLIGHEEIITSKAITIAQAL